MPLEARKKKYLVWALTIVGAFVVALICFEAFKAIMSLTAASSAPSHAVATFKLNRDDMVLSIIVLFGLLLTVFLMLTLGVVYKWMGVSDGAMPLALPDGSIRALLAFSLVLIFVCVSAFLFSAVDMKPCDDCGIELRLVTKAEILDLQKDFVVAATEAKDGDKTVYEQKQNPASKGPEDKTVPQTVNDITQPLYNVTYYPKLSKDATDLAKQIFTTLAAIFISVVSFYFGSSVTASATKAANLGGTGATTAALKDSHNASLSVDSAQKELDDAIAKGANSDKIAELRKNLADAQVNKQVNQGVANALLK